MERPMVKSLVPTLKEKKQFGMMMGALHFKQPLHVSGVAPCRTPRRLPFPLRRCHWNRRSCVGFSSELLIMEGSATKMGIDS